MSILPRHIAVILDGNGRWAKNRLLPRIAGHQKGVQAARDMVKNCVKKNIEILTLFAFSSENWKRPQKEVGFLMDLFFNGLEKEVMMLHEHHIQLRFIGNRSRFPASLSEKMAEIENLTHSNPGLKLVIAVDYGGQWDICEAARQLGKAIEQGRLESQAITPEMIAHHLSMADLPHPDLFIRTSGELRISNFMLWQLAYSELYFTDTLWPDFDENELNQALQSYARRERRYGHVDSV